MKTEKKIILSFSFVNYKLCIHLLNLLLCYFFMFGIERLDIVGRINALTIRFGKSVSNSDIYRWLLTNFDRNEWDMALCVLERVNYYSGDMIMDTLENYLNEIIDDNKNKSIYIIPVGEVGKSGYAVSYWLNKLKGKCKYISCLDDKTCLENNVLVYLDDFSGTGTSIRDFHLRNMVKSFKSRITTKYYALCVAFMDRAQALLNDYDITLKGDLYYPCFSKSKSVSLWGTYGYLKTIREFCFEKAKSIYPKWNKTKMGQHPLGYFNSQALVVFEHTTPNNTLPIIWDDKRIDGDRKWYPLFPRFPKSRIDRIKYLISDNNIKMAYLNKHNPELFSYLQGADVLLLSFLLLLSKGKSIFYIVHYLGQGFVGIKEIVKEANNKGLLDANDIPIFDLNVEKLTDKAKAIISELNSLEDKRINCKTMVRFVDPLSYIPKSFQGKT